MSYLKVVAVCVIFCAIIQGQTKADITSNIIKSITRNATRELPSKLTPAPSMPSSEQKTKAQLEAEALQADLEQMIRNLRATIPNKTAGYPGVTHAEILGKRIMIEGEIADNFSEFVDSATVDSVKSADFKTIYKARLVSRKFELCLGYSDSGLTKRALDAGYQFENTLKSINGRFVAHIITSKETCKDIESR